MYKHYQDPAQADRLLRLENAAVPQVNQAIHTYRYANQMLLNFIRPLSRDKLSSVSLYLLLMKNF